jgi:hypothetical protein
MVPSMQSQSMRIIMYLQISRSPPQLERFIVRSFHTILKQRVSVEVGNF